MKFQSFWHYLFHEPTSPTEVQHKITKKHVILLILSLLAVSSLSIAINNYINHLVQTKKPDTQTITTVVSGTSVDVTQRTDTSEFHDLDLSQTPDIELATEEEFDQYTVNQIRMIVATYVNNYHTTYHIEKDHEMTDADWLRIKSIMHYQLYGEYKSYVPANSEH